MNENYIKQIQELKKQKQPKFDQTIDLAVNLEVPKGFQSISSFMDLPKGHNKSTGILILSDVKIDIELDSIDAVVGFEDATKLSGSKLGKFGICIMASDAVKNAPKGSINKIARLLGPRGLMPTQKNGAVGDVEELYKVFKNRRIRFSTDKYNIVHCPVGKISMSDQDIAENISAVLNAINGFKSEKSNNFIKSAYLCATMGKSVKLNVKL